MWTIWEYGDTYLLNIPPEIIVLTEEASRKPKARVRRRFFLYDQLFIVQLSRAALISLLAQLSAA